MITKDDLPSLTQSSKFWTRFYSGTDKGFLSTDTFFCTPASQKFKAVLGESADKLEVVNLAQDPLPMLRRMVRMFCPNESYVLDLCSGSGSTTIAALLERCHSVAVDSDPRQHNGMKTRVRQLQVAMNKEYEATYVKAKKFKKYTGSLAKHTWLEDKTDVLGDEMESKLGKVFKKKKTESAEDDDDDEVVHEREGRPAQASEEEDDGDELGIVMSQSTKPKIKAGSALGLGIALSETEERLRTSTNALQGKPTGQVEKHVEQLDKERTALQKAALAAQTHELAPAQGTSSSSSSSSASAATFTPAPFTPVSFIGSSSSSSTAGLQAPVFAPVPFDPLAILTDAAPPAAPAGSPVRTSARQKRKQEQAKK